MNNILRKIILLYIQLEYKWAKQKYKWTKQKTEKLRNQLLNLEYEINYFHCWKISLYQTEPKSCSNCGDRPEYGPCPPDCKSPTYKHWIHEDDI